MSTYKSVASMLQKQLFGAGKKNVSGGKSIFVTPDEYSLGFSDGTLHDLTLHERIINIDNTASDETLRYPIPGSCYHPEILVCFDFNYKFTTNILQQGKISGGDRVVSLDMLRKSGTDLYNFYKYYFEYVMSYGKQGRTKPQTAIYIDFRNRDEVYINYFINRMINFFLMSITVDHPVNNIGQCSVRLADNNQLKYGKKFQLFFNSFVSILNQLFVPMVPIGIWAKGRVYKDFWFPIFHGYVNHVEPVNTSGFPEMTIRGKDILEWARISQEMVNPAILPQKEMIKQNYISILSSPLTGNDHKLIFKTMFMGGPLTVTLNAQQQATAKQEEVKKQATISVEEEEPQKQPQRINFASLGDFIYYDDAYKESKANGPPQIRLNSSSGMHKSGFGLHEALRLLSHDIRPRAVVTWGNKITPFRMFEQTTADMFYSEFESRLSIVQSAAQNVYFTFYVDGYGDVHYHPMRMANRFLLYDVIGDNSKGRESTLNHMHCFPYAQIIPQEETFSVSRQLNVDELTTYLIVAGRDNLLGSDPNNSTLLGLIGASTDFKYMKRFGYRRKSIKNPLLNVGTLTIPGKNGKQYQFVDFVAHSLLKYMNAELYSVQLNMVFRPELKVALPMYIPFDNDVFYVQSISHSVTINGEATTSVNGNFGRKARELPSDMLSFMIMSEKLYQNRENLPNAEFTVESTMDNYNSYLLENYGVNSIPLKEFMEEKDRMEEENNKYEANKLLDEINETQE
jgi:hypothetical protein